MSTQMFASGFMLGFLLGVLVCYVVLQVLGRQRFRGRNKREIDRLTEDFQDLFRQLDKGKPDSP
jgi:hypothetical protein